MLAFPKKALSAGFGFRRRPATRLLGHYRDRTFTGKPNAAYLDTPENPPYRHTQAGTVHEAGTCPVRIGRAADRSPVGRDLRPRLALVCDRPSEDRYRGGD